jgi:xanthine dehydrogenase YagT iron-sulfur-binding subunit
MRDVPNVPEALPPSGDDGRGKQKFSVSRRSFMKTMGVSAAASSLAAAAHASGIAGMVDEPEKGGPVLGPDALSITLNINGKAMPVKVEPATTLLEALRIHLGLTGAKEVCDRGACGACSVIMDGKLVVSCLTLAVDCVGSRITTVEGIGTPDAMDPVQVAFVKHDAMQCGYCTPGFVVASRVLLNNNPKPTLTEIKRGLSGNICRCGTYTNMFNAVLEASGQPVIMEQSKA